MAESSSAADVLEAWDRLHGAQKDLFTAKVQRVEELEAEVEELKRETSVYKTAYSTLLKESNDKENQISGLKEMLVEMTANAKSQNVCAIAAIDGDGYPFAPNYIQGGRLGGQEAATDLNSRLTAEIGPDTRLMVFVYLNKLGLVDAFMKNNLLKSPYIFDEFMRGFNQASPLFHMVDVGPGKEAADAKLRELCTYFARIPQTKKIYFAGAHDAGYATFLRSIRTDGFSDKFVLLRSSISFAREMSALGLAELDLGDLFGGGDLSPPSKSLDRTFYTGGPAANDARSGQGWTPRREGNVSGTRMMTRGAFIAGEISLKEGLHSRSGIELEVSLGKNCYHFHFSAGGCRNGQKCNFAHDGSIGDRLGDIRKEGFATLQEFHKGKQVRSPDISTSRHTKGSLSQSELLSEGSPNDPSRSSTPSNISRLPSATLSPAISAQDVSSAEPPSASDSPTGESPFVPLVTVLLQRIAEGEDSVQWAQVGAYLKALDPDYLGKNGLPSTFKEFMNLAKEQRVVWLDVKGPNNIWVSLHHRVTRLILSQQQE